MNIHQDFLALEELQFITGRKQKMRMIEQLNIMGIPFVTNGNGLPIVRRDYAQLKNKKNPQVSNENNWLPNVLRSA